MAVIHVEIPMVVLRAVADLSRNGRWGRCSACANDEPEKCQFYDRYDHRLKEVDLDSLLGWHVRRYWV